MCTKLDQEKAQEGWSQLHSRNLRIKAIQACIHTALELHVVTMYIFKWVYYTHLNLHNIHVHVHTTFSTGTSIYKILHHLEVVIT